MCAPARAPVIISHGSQAVLARNDAVAFATEDHKPQSRIESTRVLAAGGYIMMGAIFTPTPCFTSLP